MTKETRRYCRLGDQSCRAHNVTRSTEAALFADAISLIDAYQLLYSFNVAMNRPQLGITCIVANAKLFKFPTNIGSSVSIYVRQRVD